MGTLKEVPALRHLVAPTLLLKDSCDMPTLPIHASQIHSLCVVHVSIDEVGCVDAGNMTKVSEYPEVRV